MKITSILTGIAMMAFLFSCGGNEKQGVAQDDHGMEMAEALNVEVDNKIDPVCGMEMKSGIIRDTLHYNENLYGFCSKSCKTTFAKTPEDFQDKFGN